MSWPTQQLGELCEFKGGLWTGKKPPFTKAKVLRITNFTKGCELDVTDAIELDVEERQLQSRRLVDGDIIIEKSGGGPNQPVGRVALCADLDGVYSFSNFTTALRINDRSKIEPKFLHQYLKTLYFRGDTEAMQSNSTNLRNLNLDAYRAIEVPLPPLPEQQRIVGKLDAAFAALTEAQAHVERNRANARELFESYLNGVFEGKGDGWVEKRLGDLIDIQNGYAFSSNEYKDEGHFLIRISNVQDGEITLANPKYVSIDNPRLKRFVLNEGDILVSLTGNIGRVGIMQAEHLPAALNQRVARITLKDEKTVRHNFLFFFLRSNFFREHLQAAGHGAAQQNVSTKEIAEVELSLPPLVEQQRVLDALRELQIKTDELETTYQQKLSELAGLKKAVLGAAFRGEL